MRTAAVGVHQPEGDVVRGRGRGQGEGIEQVAVIASWVPSGDHDTSSSPPQGLTQLAVSISRRPVPSTLTTKTLLESGAYRVNTTVLPSGDSRGLDVVIVGDDQAVEIGAIRAEDVDLPTGSAGILEDDLPVGRRGDGDAVRVEVAEASGAPVGADVGAAVWTGRVDGVAAAPEQAVTTTTAPISQDKRMVEGM